METGVLGTAVKYLRERGVKFEHEIRPRRSVLGIVMKQDPQSFVLIAKKGELGESFEESFATTHRFLVETSFTHKQPIILAYEPGEGRIRFYAFDPWKIKEKRVLVRIDDYISMRFPIGVGWRWEPPKDLAVLWERMRSSRYSEEKLERFI